MSQLMDDIIGTANSFTKNFSDRGNFDLSFESLATVDDLLEEARDFVSEEKILFLYFRNAKEYLKQGEYCII